MERLWSPGWPIDLRTTLGSLRRGAGDPTWIEDPAGWLWRGIRTPQGPASLGLRVDRAAGQVHSEAHGPGAGWALDAIPRMLGEADDPSGFEPPPVLALRTIWRSLGPGWRIGASGMVFDALAGAILEQKVTGGEARSAWRTLVRAHGQPAPGRLPEGVGGRLRVPPEPAAWRAIPSWEWHRAGVDGSRSGSVVRAAAVAGRLEQCVVLDREAAAARMRAVRGVGVWTAAEVAQRALGDADAVSYGDFHIAKNTVYALTGELDGDDARMAELLEPWAGHRYRVTRLVEFARIVRPPRGPRFAGRDFRFM